MREQVQRRTIGVSMFDQTLPRHNIMFISIYEVKCLQNRCRDLFKKLINIWSTVIEIPVNHFENLEELRSNQHFMKL